MGGMRGSRQSRTGHPGLNSRGGGGVWCGRWSITHPNTPTRSVGEVRLPRECGRSGCLCRWAITWRLLEACSRIESGNIILKVLRRWGAGLGGRV